MQLYKWTGVAEYFLQL